MLLAAVIGATAILFGVGADVGPLSSARDTAHVVEDVTRCCAEIVSAPLALSLTPSNGRQDMNFVTAEMISASRLRVVDRLLPVGVAPEQGLQVKTILVARSVSAMFPEIQQIGGVRPDSLRWHPNGLALDVMIPNPGSTEGIALGDHIVSYALENAGRFGVQDCIWRGTYYTPNGAKSGGYGHYDHVHITTLGGGYPTGGEVYAR